jgi:hypothetical protein
MRSALIFIAVALLSSSVFASDGLYRCSGKTMLMLQDDGTLGPIPNAYHRDWLSNFLIDTATGVLRRATGTPEHLAIIQKQVSGQWDFVASPRATPLSASIEVLRLRSWGEGRPTQFYFFRFSTVVTGTCELVR